MITAREAVSLKTRAEGDGADRRRHHRHGARHGVPEAGHQGDRGRDAAAPAVGRGRGPGRRRREEVQGRWRRGAGQRQGQGREGQGGPRHGRGRGRRRDARARVRQGAGRGRLPAELEGLGPGRLRRQDRRARPHPDRRSAAHQRRGRIRDWRRHRHAVPRAPRDEAGRGRGRGDRRPQGRVRLARDAVGDLHRSGNRGRRAVRDRGQGQGHCGARRQVPDSRRPAARWR